MLSDKGISVDLSKVQEVLDWKAPTSLHKVRSFLGLAGYYRRFILDFSKVAKPMTRLLQKDVKFVWNPECETAFCTLRTLLTSAPMLAQLDIKKPFDGFCGFRMCPYAGMSSYRLCLTSAKEARS